MTAFSLPYLNTSMAILGIYRKKKNESLKRKVLQLYKTGDFTIRQVAQHKDIQKDPMWVWRAIHELDPNLRKGKKKKS